MCFFGVLHSEPSDVRAIALQIGRGHVGLGAGIVGLVTALLLSGLGHFLSLGPSFLIYKPLKVWCSASSVFFFKVFISNAFGTLLSSEAHLLLGLK